MPTIWLGVCFLPTFVDLLYQFRGVFVPQEGQEGGIGFTLGHVWLQYCGNLPLAIGLAVGFPILVLLLNYKELCRDSIYRFSWQIYGMSFLMAFCLYEKGFREMDFNFSWGYMHGMFFVFLMTLIVMVKNIREWWKSWKVIFVIGEIAVFFYHLVCGVNFLMYAVMGNDLAGF